MMCLRVSRSLLTPILRSFVAGFLLVAGCSGSGGGGSGGDGGSSTRVTISFGSQSAARESASRAAALIPSTIRSIRVSVQGEGMQDLVEEAPVPEGGQATITLLVPSGARRTFLAEALDAARTVRYSGSTTTDVLGERLDVAVRLRFSTSNPALGRWRFVNPTPTAHDLHRVAYGNGTFVAVGASGTILSSTDSGASWITRSAETGENLVDVAFGGGAFVAVGDSGGVYVSASAGATWTRADAADGGFSAVAFGGGRFLALGADGVVLTSGDGGVTWAPVSTTGLPAPGQPTAAAHGGGAFYALFEVSLDGRPVTELYLSADGATWTPQGVYASSGSRGLAADDTSVLVASANGQIVVVRPDFDPVAYYVAEGGLYGATFGDNGFAVSGSYGFLATSGDPSLSDSWSYLGADTAAGLRGCAAGGGALVAVGDGGMIVTAGADTTDLRWSTQFTTDLGPVGFGGGVFVAEGSDDRILSSTDGGATWAVWFRSPPNVAGAPWVGALTEFAYGGGTFVAVGPLSLKQAVDPVPESFTPTAYVSTDGGATWSYAVSGITEGLTGIAFGSGTFVASSASNGVYRCQPPVPPAETWVWTRVSVPDPSEMGIELAAVAFGQGLFVAAGRASYSGAVFVSSDSGQTWTAVPGLSVPALTRLVYADGVFVALDELGSAFTSVDGSVWTEAGTVPLNDSLVSGLAYGGGALVATDTTGALFSSADNANTWAPVPFRSPFGLSSVTFGDGAFLAGGQQGTIIKSDDL